MAQTDAFREAITQLIVKYFGYKTAMLYGQFFVGKNSITIFATAKELLTKTVGEEVADEELKNLTSQFGMEAFYE